MRRALLVLPFLFGAPAFADTKTPGAPHREGEYGGVAPGQPQNPGAKPAKRPHPKGTLTWIGFEAKNGGAQVFFQAAAPFEVKQHLEGSTLVIHLALTRLGPNAWRQIDTRFFDNPISGMVARVAGPSRATKDHPALPRGIAVRVAFKNARDARPGNVEIKPEPDGMFYAYVTFPEGAEPKPEH